MSKKLTYSFVKEQIEKEGYELVDKEYIKSSVKLSLRCPNKHDIKINFNKFNSGGRCSYCWQEKKKKQYKRSLEYVKEYIRKEGFTLLSEYYVNNREKLLIQCEQKHEFRISFSSFQQGTRCAKCYQEKRALFIKKTVDHVSQEFSLKGFKLLSKEYTKNTQKLEVLCPQNHKIRLSYNSFQRGTRCAKCYHQKLSQKSKYSFEDVKNYIQSKGFTLLSKNYKKAHDQIKILCPKQHTFNLSFSVFKYRNRCPMCSKTGFDYNKPGSIYYAKVNINGKNYYKIGITNKPLHQRIKNIHPGMKIIWHETFLFGIEAYKKEQEIIERFCKYLIDDPKLPLNSGHTETFIKDVLKKDIFDE